MHLLIRLLGVGLGFMLHDVLAQTKGNYLPFPKDLLQPDAGNCTDIGKPLILTPLIQSGKIQKARDLARVVRLSDVTSYSGLFTVRKEFNANMFFWFFPAASKQKDDPLLIWLQGGPGVSSMLGLFDENGPFYVDSNITLHQRQKYAWSLTHSIIYFDNPVGTGFSFAEDGGYVKNQEEVGHDLYEALQQFLTLFPEYRSRDLYVTGESYAVEPKFYTTQIYKFNISQT